MRRILTPIAAFVSWHRRAVGALLAAAAVLIVATTLQTPTPATPAVVTSTGLAAGHILAESDLALRQVPDEAMPAEAITHLDDAVGRQLIAPVGPGTILQPGLVAADEPAGPGRAVVPIPVPDESLRLLLSPGDRISLVAQGPEGLEVVSRDARVVAQPEGETPTSQLGSASVRSSGMILVDVDSADAAIVASLGQAGGLSIVLGSI